MDNSSSQIDFVEVFNVVRQRVAFGQSQADLQDLVDAFGSDTIFFAYQGVKLLDEKVLAPTVGSDSINP